MCDVIRIGKFIFNIAAWVLVFRVVDIIITPLINSLKKILTRLGYLG